MLSFSIMAYGTPVFLTHCHRCPLPYFLFGCGPLAARSVCELGPVKVLLWCKLSAMQTYFQIAAVVLYLVCAVLRSRRGALIAGLTAAAWLLHGAALWVSVAAYWIENRNYGLDGLRRLVMPFAALAVALQAIFPGDLVPLEGRSPMFGWHIAIAT